jgi:hypothetical protein
MKKEMSKEEMREMIIDYLDNCSIWKRPSEIADDLEVDYELCWEILRELHDEKEIICQED